MLNDQLDLFAISIEEGDTNISDSITFKKTEKKQREKKSKQTVAAVTKKEPLQKREGKKTKENLIQKEEDLNIKTEVNEKATEKISVKCKELRPVPSVQKGDKVKVSSRIDNSPENDGYFQTYRGKKGIVVDLKEVNNAKDNRYQYNVWVSFKEKINEIGIFYDLELTIIEDKM